MSELIAEARVLVTPDTTNFRPLLIKQVNAAAKGVVVPIAVTPVITGATGTTAASAGLVAAQQELAAATNLSSTALRQEQLLLARGAVLLDSVAIKEEATAAAVRGANDARRRAAASAAAQTRQLGQLERGIGATALSFGGLRGATLAASGSFIAGAAAATIFAKSISSVVSFDTELRTFQVTAGATADEMEQVSAAARELGSDVTLPGVSAQDAAEAFTELSKAGLSLQDSLAGARGVLQLATAAQISNADATELAASALNAFGLSGDQAVHVADVLANAANDAQGSIADIGIALRQASAAADQSGLTLEQTVAILTQFARAGIQSSDAGTLLRTLLIRLINPTDKAAKVIKDLGLQLRDAQGNIRLDVFQQFADATRDMTRAERDRDAAIIAGQDAFRGLSILARQGRGALEAQVASIDKSGTAARVASARTAGLAGSFENAKNQAAQFGLTLGEVAKGPVGIFLTASGNLFESLNKISSTLGSIFHAEQVGAFGDEASKNFDQLAEAAGKLQQNLSTGDAQEFTGQLTVGLQAVADELAKTGKAMVREGFLTRVLETFIRLSPDVKKAMADNVITPAEQAQLEATALGRAFIEAIPHTADLFESFAGSAKSTIEDARAEIANSGTTLGQAMAEAVHDSDRSALPAARQTGEEIGNTVAGGITAAINAAKGDIADAFRAATRSDRLRAGRQASDLVDIEFQGGTPQQQLTGLRALLETQKQIVNDLTARGAPREKIDAAKQDAIATQNQIDSILSQIDSANQATVNKAKQAASNREAQAREAAAERDRADQAVLDLFAPAQARLNLASIRANATARLSDDLALQNAIIAEAEREKKIIADSVKTVKTKNEELRKQKAIIAAAETERTRILGEIAQTATENRQKAADAIRDFLGKQITLAELRENDSAEVAAINKAIANARNRIKNYKKLGLNLQDEKIALETLINDRDAVLKKKDEISQEKAGVSIFEILKENVETFNRTGGNLVTGNQPFAGPTGFTADVAQFLHRAPTAPPLRTADFSAPLVSSNAELIRVIQDNTDAIRENTGVGGGNRTTPGGIAGLRGAAMARFYKSRQAMQLTEAESP